MNSNDIEFVRTKFQEQSLPGPSKSLDEEICHLANQQAVRNRNMNGHSFRLSHLAAATASVVITLGLFTAMYQVIQPQQPDSSIAVSGTSYEDLKFISLDEPQLKDYRIPRPERELLARVAPTQDQRDEILRNMELPEPHQIVAKMELLLENQRTNIEGELALAFSDIELSILNDELRNARSRYYALLQVCQTCDLPNTLEVLMINSVAPT